MTARKCETGTNEWLDDCFDRFYATGRDKSTAQIVYGGRKTRARGIGTKVISEMAPATGNLCDTVAGACVRKTMIQTGIAIQLFRATNNRFPCQLVELVPQYLPEIPQDEFANGQPLSFTQTENGCRLGSVGNDQYSDTEDGIWLGLGMSPSRSA